jgi:nucleoside triphosphatase
MTKQSYPEPTVGALIFNPESKILLVRSHKWRNKYVIPGGHIELGETIVAALIREVKEETGLYIYDIEFIGLQEFIFDDAFWKKGHFIFFDYACKTDSTHVKLNSESEEYLWVSLEDTVNHPVEPYTQRTIQAYLKKHSS